MQILPHWKAVLEKIFPKTISYTYAGGKKKKSASFQIHRTSKRAKNILFDIYSFYKIYFHFILRDF